MKILHTADLHIGKVVNGFSMLQDQKHVLTQMIDIVKKENIQAFIIAGDVYDRPIPSAEAVSVFHWFIQALHEAGTTILCISGNHDSPERLSFANGILEENGVCFAGTFEEKCKQITLQDAYGSVVFTLMPFVKPALLGENTSQKAVERMLPDVYGNKRQVLITHYFVTNAGKEPELSDSESPVSVGGLDQVDASLFAHFHYTALGHIHKPQNMYKEKTTQPPVVYAGSPLAYSFSECAQEKSVVLIEMDGEGDCTLKRIPLLPLHRMRKLKGALEDLITPVMAEHLDNEDYLQITLTNEEELIDPIGSLRSVYPNVMQLLFEKKEKEVEGELVALQGTKQKTPKALFEDFYYLLREKPMDEARKEVMDAVVRELL